MNIRASYLALILTTLPLFLGCATHTPAQCLAEQTVQAQATARQVSIYLMTGIKHVISFPPLDAAR